MVEELGRVYAEPNITIERAMPPVSEGNRANRHRSSARDAGLRRRNELKEELQANR